MTDLEVWSPDASGFPQAGTDACLTRFASVDAAFVRRKEFYYGWRADGRSLTLRLSDYMSGAPDDVVADLCLMICDRASGRGWSPPESYLRFVDSDSFISSRRPEYVRRSRNLSRSPAGEHADLIESVQRLLDSGLVTDADLDNSYISWTRRDGRRRVGFCSTMFRVVGISSALDSPQVPESVRDYVVYHECLHLRQRYRASNRTHDAQFRRWERSFPGWEDAEAALRRLGMERDVRPSRP